MTSENPRPERTIGQLVADASHDIQGLIHSEIALAKAEVTKGVKIAGTGAGFLGGAAFVGLLGLIFVFHTLAMVIAIWLPVWAGYLITTVLLFAVAGLLAWLGIKKIKKARPKPERAIAQAEKTVAVLKQQL